MSSLLSISDVHFAYAPANGTSVPIFNGFSLSVPEGQLVRLIGPNGSGKSTLLDLIAGRLSPLGGTVALDGHPPRQSRISVVYLRQKPIENVAPNLTVAENLAFSTDVRRPILDWSRSATRSLQQIDERLRHFDLSITHLCPDQTVGTLSGGQVQWLALAMALLARPEVLLLDEPTAFLDKKRAHEFFNVIAKYHQHTSCTIVFVCHDEVAHSITSMSHFRERHVQPSGDHDG